MSPGGSGGADGSRARPLDRSFFARDALEVAPALLHKVLVAGDGAGRIVEVEAYRGAEDPASHGHRGPTDRNRVMFGPPGHLYVYFTYGMHWCANVVAGSDGECSAVLIRALEPLWGVDEMRTRRPAARRATDLCSGPAKLCAALGVTGDDNGADLCRPDARVFVADDGADAPDDVARGPRIGISVAQELPWRFAVASSSHLSRSVAT